MPKYGRSRRREKKDAPDMSAEMEQRVLHVVWSDRVTNAEMRQRTNRKDIVVVDLNLKWKWGSHGPAKTDMLHQFCA